MFIKRLDKLIGCGAQADVYAIDNKAIKVFKEQSSKTAVFCEAAIHSMVETINLPAPKIYEVIQIENKMAIVMELIEGISMKQIVMNDMDNLSFYLDTVTNLQEKLHGISVNVPGFPTMKDKFRQRIFLSSLLSDSQKEKLQAMLNGFTIGNSLCHGDFHLMNLIKTENEIVIIDWIDATSGSPEADLCRTYLLYELYSPKGFADMYLDVYCRKTNKNRNEILKWLPIIAGVRLSENNKQEKDQLLQWVDASPVL